MQRDIYVGVFVHFRVKGLSVNPINESECMCVNVLCIGTQG